MKLWDKGYSTDSFVEEFTVGRDRELDLFLAEADVLGNMAHMKMLNSIGLISDADCKLLEQGLREIYAKVQSGEFVIEEGVEDVHSQVEFMLTKMCGDAGKRIHTGRSRNDQVMVDIKLFSRSALIALQQSVEKLFEVLMAKAEEYRDVLMPGYTHMQVAMPSSFGMWLSAYAEALADDLLMLGAAYSLVNTNPLGSGAGYGSSVPLNREMTTRLLGFEDLAYNSVYAQMQRGKTERTVLTAIAAVASTVGRLAQDVCLYSCANFGFVKLPDAFTTGSSIMPHKKNPDIFELIRAKCNRMQALPMEVTLISTNLPSGYFRDMQLTKEIYVPTFSEIVDVLRMAATGLEQMWINRDILSDEKYKYLFTVEDVNDAVAKGVPFRDAYREVGMRVQNGTYQHDGRELNHTHAGSIGNLCLDKISQKFARHKFDYSAALAAEQKLMQ
ncbi:MAG: argininosuccinate lyase [Alistipes sp.]|nr:argininosuccinate lyase [Alistipes sp.]MBR2332052.1 argininosuccinate lyase [Alistipes sp.]MBR7096999.1 argininosuccinate lyase [Alistipes sp.]